MKADTYRISVVDALRGFAIFGILMMHCFEHFNYFVYPAVENKLLLFTDKIFTDAIPFLFAGKAYAVFALLFGFSFFVQNDHRKQKGANFGLRFLWRLALLFLWGCLNSVFYMGDVLVTFSLIGILLPLLSRLPDKVLIPVAFLFLLQPEQWIKIVCALINPDYTVPSLFANYYAPTFNMVSNGNILDMLKGTYYNQMYSFSWWVGVGRVYQVAALFLFGLLLGRNGMFLNKEKNSRFWIKQMIISIILFFPLSGIKSILLDFVENAVIRRQLNLVLSAYASFAFFTFIVAVFVLVYYHHTVLGRWLSKLEPCGKMSLTMYITQSVMGGFVFYNWGLGLGPQLSVTFSILIGLVIFAIQYTFAVMWLKRHKHGPLEHAWKKLTWIGK